MNIKVIHSGSSGNLVNIDDTIIIDAGWPEMQVGRALFLTHAHSDHTKHLDKFTGIPMFALRDTIEKLQKQIKFAYMQFNEIEPDGFYEIKTDKYVYTVHPIAVKHDVPCVAFDITRTSYDGDTVRIFYGSDFNSIVNEDLFIHNLKRKVYDSVYIEANNTITPTDLVDIYFQQEGEGLPKDEFHRRRSYQTHCNVDYLISLFQRAGYSEDNKFTEPVMLLHKSSFYYALNPDRVIALCKMVNIINPVN